jgi:hypothetical protein
VPLVGPSFPKASIRRQFRLQAPVPAELCKACEGVKKVRAVDNANKVIAADDG